MNELPHSKFRPWIIWFSAGLFTMYQFAMQGSPGVMIQYLTCDFSIDIAQVGLITSFFFYSYILMQIPAGTLVDSYGPKAMLITGSILAGVFCIIFSSCNSLWVAKLSRLLMGLVCAPGIVSIFCLASRWFDKRRFAMIVGFTETLTMIGAALATVLLSYTVKHIGWRHAVLLCGAAGFTIALLIIFAVKDYPSNQKELFNKPKKYNLKKELLGLKIIMKKGQVWIAGIYSGLVFCTFPAFFAMWAIPFFIDKYHFKQADVVPLVAMGFLGGGVGGPFLGWLSGKIHKRKIIMIFGSFIAMLFAVAVIFLDLHPFAMSALTFGLGFSCSSYILSFAIVEEKVSPDIKGKAMGFTNMLSLLFGAPLVQPIIGLSLKDMIDPLDIPIIIFKWVLIPLPIALILAFILSFFISEDQPKSKNLH